MLIIGSIVLRVDDIAAQTAFWTQALDYVVRDPHDDDFVVLVSRTGAGPNVSLDTMRSERILPPRIHLDLYAQDQAAEVARLRALGAAEVQWDGRPDDADYVILEDPEGNRFCVVDSAEWDGWARRSDTVTG
ncbi:VOC family protein [Microbacterium sp. JZ31]|uniref:VOC family protein n=1 Tax=Microbacterium sp. JZ31 TaxID=1906274 RepID=UPI00193427B7|nr:VOC family protein [Microbacterium sp. JZ31]